MTNNPHKKTTHTTGTSNTQPNEAATCTSPERNHDERRYSRSLHTALRHLFALALLLLTSSSLTNNAHAVWHPAIQLGYQVIPVPKQAVPQGSMLLGIELNHFWEDWGIFAMGIGLPVEFDFTTRVSVAPKFMLEWWGSVRLIVGPVLDIGPAYSFFALRAGTELGYRLTGKRAEVDSFAPMKAGVYFFFYVDTRFKNPDQEPGQELRFNFGLKIATQF